jgi:branched-chain amino acid transport system ATP-binding protein
MSDGLLRVERVDSGYGHVSVLRAIDLEVGQGEIVSIIGANGAGKSTLLKTVVGFLRPSSGHVFFDGADVTGVPPERLVRRGIALVPEGRLLFGSLSVAENLALGTHAVPRRERSAALVTGRERVFGLFPVLEERADQPAATLSGGEQQMLAVARALMSGPRLLLLDEPSLGLAPRVIAEIFSVLDQLREQGVTVLLVEQDARLALKHSDRGYVLRTGSVALQGSAAELLADEKVRTIYLGAWRGEDDA